MCGRIAQSSPSLSVARSSLHPRLPPRPLSAVPPSPKDEYPVENWNAGPGHEIHALLLSRDGSLLSIRARWGFLHPRAALACTGGNGDAGAFYSALMFNARSETAWEKPTFRPCAVGDGERGTGGRRGRCVVPAEGFYEWKMRKISEGGKWTERKCPYFVHVAARDGGARPPLLLAGLYRATPVLLPDGSVVDVTTVALLTRASCDGLKWLHHRMPVVLSPEGSARWLRGDGAMDEVREAAKMYRVVVGGAEPGSLAESETAGGGVSFAYHPVSRRMNKVSYRGELADVDGGSDVAAPVDEWTETPNGKTAGAGAITSFFRRGNGSEKKAGLSDQIRSDAVKKISKIVDRSPPKKSEKMDQAITPSSSKKLGSKLVANNFSSRHPDISSEGESSVGRQPPLSGRSTWLSSPSSSSRSRTKRKAGAPGGFKLEMTDFFLPSRSSDGASKKGRSSS